MSTLTQKIQSDLPDIDPVLRQGLTEKLLPRFHDYLEKEHIDDDLDRAFEQVYLPLAAWLSGQHRGQLQVVGLNGAQGSGKSTLAGILQMVLTEGFGRHVQVLSIDDLYLQPEQRRQLAESVHPLFETRGVPGTHDVQMGLDLLARLRAHAPGETVYLPRFDKANDRRHHESGWTPVEAPLDVLILEGWCVGALPQAEQELEPHANILEQEEDAQGHWRRAVNAALAADYQKLFAEIDVLLMLRVPGMEHVHRWRGLQESKLGQRSGMDAAALRRFVMHYERLTLAQLEEMPSRADLVLQLDEHHQVQSIRWNKKRRAEVVNNRDG